MARPVLLIIAVLYACNALYMWFAPVVWYERVPGVSMTGPYNLHFIRDIALAYLVSAGALAYGALKIERAVAVLGAAWPGLHALFHVWIWIARGLPADQVALANLLGIQLPAWLGLAAAFTLARKEPHA